MANTYVITRQWGYGLGIRLTPAIVHAAKLHAHQMVRVSARAGQITISPAEASTLTLEQRLALFEPARHGGEIMASEAIRWEKL